MAIFYRVETIPYLYDDGDLSPRQGAYNGGLAGVALIYEDAQNMDTHPSPLCDAGLREIWKSMLDDCGKDREYLFGFNSLEQYKVWFFKEEGCKLIMGKGVIGVYEVDDSKFYGGQFQAIAHKEFMVHLHDLCPYTMEEIEVIPKLWSDM